VADPNVKFFFLVAGYDYEAGGHEKGLDFDSMCTSRVNEWIWFLNDSFNRKDAVVSADTTLRFLRFSVETGKIEVIEREFVAGRGIKQGPAKKSGWKPLNTIGTGDKFDPITFVSKGPFRAIDWATDYELSPGAHTPHLKQSAATRDIISIVDVYNSVRGAPEGSVLDLSVFSHGWIEGPVLVNSSDKLNAPQLRDPDDKDGRASLDFNGLMGEQGDGTINAPLRLYRFMRAFDPRGVMQTWGCSYDIENPLIQQTLRRIRKGKVTDDTIIDFDFSDPEHEWWNRYAVVDSTSTFFPDDPRVVRISRTFSHVKRFLRRRLERSYAFQFASHVPGLYVLGALPGTGAENETTAYHLLQVCAIADNPKDKKRMRLGCSDGFASTFNFYLQHLGIKTDRRGYGIFDAKTVQKIAADIDADIAADAADFK
jgi:hypothetical protein